MVTTESAWKMSGIAVEYLYPMLQYTASHRAAAHIMNAVVSISMSPESFSSGDSVAAGAWGTAAGTDGASFSGASLVESSIISGPGIMAQDVRILVYSAYTPEHPIHDHDGRSRRLHLVRRKARAMARSHDACPHPFAALRPRRVRRRAGLQDGNPRHRDLPP